jgi:hypothetical protein
VLPKLEVEGSNPFFRSLRKSRRNPILDYLPTVGSAACFLRDNGVIYARAFSRKGFAMPNAGSRVPGYRLHKASGRAIVKLGGKVHYLGKHGSRTSKLEYARLIARWSVGRGEHPHAGRDDITIVELIFIMASAFRRRLS